MCFALCVHCPRRRWCETGQIYFVSVFVGVESHASRRTERSTGMRSSERTQRVCTLFGLCIVLEVMSSIVRDGKDDLGVLPDDLPFASRMFGDLAVVSNMVEPVGDKGVCEVPHL